MMKFIVVLAFLAIVPLAVYADVPIPWVNCGSGTDHVKISSATASSWPPAPGQDVTITIASELDESVSGGSYVLSVNFDGFPIINQQGPLSALGNVTWPVPAGPLTISQTVSVPSVIPANSTININSSALDENGQELLCLTLSFVVGGGDDESYELDGEITAGGEGEFVPEFDMSQEAMPELPEEPTMEETPSFEVGLFDLVEARAEKVSMKHVASELLKLLAGEARILADQLEQPEDPIPVPYTNCGQSGDEITIVNITSTEWPPVLGSETNLTVNFIANVEIQDGTYTAVVSVDGFPLVTKTGDISKYFKLPIAAGPVTMVKDIKLPDLPISGTVGIQLSATDNNSNEMFCLDLTFSV